MIYRIISSSTELNELLSYAEENNIEYDIWNPEDLLSDEETSIELGLSQWPDNEKNSCSGCGKDLVEDDYLCEECRREGLEFLSLSQ